MSDYRCLSECRSRGREFDPGPVPCFLEIDHNIISTIILLLSADSRRVVVHEILLNHRLLSVTRESMRMKYCLTTWSSLPRKKVWLGELTVQKMTIAVDWEVKQQTNY